jgi:L-asparaginase
MSAHKKILLIYTGGTIGMMRDPETNELRPFNFEALTTHIPELKKFDIELSSLSFEKPIDSSNMEPAHWAKLAQMINDHYSAYNGFVILHGSDTMAYTASALSFMLQNISKPVILTGSQLPIGTIRTDGKENIITAIEIAAAQENGKALVPEVCIYFEFKLFRGNRTSKTSALHFNAFSSGNYPLLAEAGVSIQYHSNYIQTNHSGAPKLFTAFDTQVGIVKVFPGISKAFLQGVFSSSALKGIILETFGSGNMTTGDEVMQELDRFIQNGGVVVNVTQCQSGSVEQGKYETSSKLNSMGVISGGDMTTEAALTKLMYALGKNMTLEEVKKCFETNLCGEITL